ncbi:MAG TPA: SlyX family protein [Mariprofundaceae bacterium]|nr:SlyX family protein [Mariprofundaceae bacterium]
MDEQLIDLEVKLSFQDRMIQDLNEVVIRQQHEIEKLQVEIRSIRSQLTTTDSPQIRKQSEEEPPPHY